MSLKRCLSQRAEWDHIFKGFSWHTRSYGIERLQKQLLYCDPTRANCMEILSGVRYVFITEVLQLTLRTASLIILCLCTLRFVFQYTLEISLKGRGATTGIWLLIPCLLWFDVDGCRMIPNVALVGFTVKLPTGKTGLRKIFCLTWEPEQG